MKITDLSEKPDLQGPRSGAQTGRARWLIFGALLLTLSAPAQWITQSISLKAGWNAVYLHVDVSYDTLDELIAFDASNPIQEVWLWTPTPTTMQFVQSPQEPVDSGSQWASWKRSAAGGASRLQRLIGNAAYLVYVDTNTVSYTWIVKGKPVAPQYQWTTTGLNFLGFPTMPNEPPSFEAFLSLCPELQQNAEIYQYPGGELGLNNPARVFALRTTPVTRGKAFWIRSGNLFNRYFSPFEIVWSGNNGIDFGQKLGVRSFRLRNLTAGALTVTVHLLPSESPPTGQTSIMGTPPLLVRGSLSTVDLTYAFTQLATTNSHSWMLPARGQNGSEIEVVLGLDRSMITSAPGELLAGVLRFTDSLGIAQVDAPVTATAGSSAGLWVGGVTVHQVGEYLKTYARSGTGLAVDTNGQYIVTGINTNLGAVGRPFPLRLILHNPEAGGNAVLLQRVYCGMDANTNPVVATSESALNSYYLAQARRISASHLPWSRDNAPWSFDGPLALSSTITATVPLDFNDQAANPFVHTYHPDHDNLDSKFAAPLDQGAESYSVQRVIQLEVVMPGEDFASRTETGQMLSGRYSETITVLGLPRAGNTNDTRVFETRGTFGLNRIAETPTLTTVP
ncbi:MAG: hypothetical protein KIS67_11545 [Verrucomicrobiae bacterium]|nr:hypothetical protein [Verrucomicrobiae bacterium]